MEDTFVFRFRKPLSMRGEGPRDSERSVDHDVAAISTSGPHFKFPTPSIVEGVVVREQGNYTQNYQFSRPFQISVEVAKKK